MSFLVENGTGVKGATSYATVAYFRAYFADRGVDVTALLDATIQGLLVAGTDYIGTRWGLRLLGNRLWDALYSRSTFTLTGQPVDGETVTVGTQTYTFRAAAVADTEVEIQDTILDTLVALADVIGGDPDNDDFVDFMFADADVASLTIFTSADGVSTTDTVNLGSWSAATTTGYSSHPQSLEFPREDLYDRAGVEVVGVPEKIKQATCEYAYRANTAALAPDPTVDSTVTSVSKSVGPISTSITYSAGEVLRAMKSYPAADRLMQEYMNTSGVVRM